MSCHSTPAFSASRRATKPENTKSLRGAGALERVVKGIAKSQISAVLKIRKRDRVRYSS
jgi:hypothetical protein